VIFVFLFINTIWDW